MARNRKGTDSQGRLLFFMGRETAPSVLDAYLSSMPAGVSIWLLSKKDSPNLKEAVAKFSAQRGNPIELRTSSAFHDRIVFIDGADCWVLGQSIKDAAKSMPTYLAPLSSDVAADKLAAYEEVWSKAAPV